MVEYPRIRELSNSTCTQPVDLQKKLAVENSMVKSIAQSLIAVLGPSISSLIENFPAVLNKYIRDNISIGSIKDKSGAETATDGTTLHFTVVALLERCEASTKEGYVLDSVRGANVLRLYKVFSI